MFAIHRYRGGFAGVAAAAVIIVIALAFWGYGTPAAGPPPTAHAQPAPVRPPPNQQARNTGEPGEVIVTWGTATGANSYRVGWLNHSDYLAAGSDWLQRFTFANVPLRTREYKITRLTPGEEYWFIVASVDAQNRMYWPAQWIEKFTVTAAPTPTPMPTPTPGPTAGHGSGASGGSGDGAMCPVTGLPIGDGYKEIGETVNWGGFRFGVRSVATPATVSYTTGEREAYGGRRWLMLTLDASNGFRSDVTLVLGQDYVLDTNAGSAFGYNSETTLPAGYEYTNGYKMLFDVPQNATIAVLAMRPLIDGSSTATNDPVLFRIPIPQ